MDGELLSLKWNNHKSTFLQVVGSLRIKATYTDATLACNGKFYPVHRLVLSSCSEYFNSIFEYTTCKSPVIVLKDIDSKNLEYLLDYMYVGEVNVRQNELGALVGAAECLKIKGLAVPDEDSSTFNHNSSRNNTFSRSRSRSPPSKRKKLSKSSDTSKNLNTNTHKRIVEARNSETEATDPTLIDPIFPAIKVEPKDTENINSLNLSPNLESEKSQGIEGTFSIEKEEPGDPPEENSSDVGGSLLYDNEDHSWRGDNGFQSDLMDAMAGSVSSEPSCSSQQPDQQMKFPLWPRNYLEINSLASTSSPTAIDPIGSLQDHLGSRLKHLKSGLSKIRNNLSRDGFPSRPFFRRSHRFVCHLCSYSSKEKANLRRHMMTHTGEKPFKCPDCDYRSVAYHTIKRHLRTHTKEKPYRCSVCDFTCSYSETLKRHRLNHV